MADPAMSRDVAVVVLGVALAVGNVAVCCAAVFAVCWFCKQLSHATEIIVRHQDDSRAYERKCIADALASGRQPAHLATGEPQGQERVPGAVARLARAAAEDVDTLT